MRTEMGTSAGHRSAEIASWASVAAAIASAARPKAAANPSPPVANT
jgi:hypothetical protein